MYPTHKSDNTLDLVFTELMTQIHIEDLSCGTFLSDHCTVNFKTTIPRDEPITRIITYRKLKSVNLEEMMKDIDAIQHRLQDENLTGLINSFESVLKDALDKHAAAITKTLMTRKSNPWFTDEVRPQINLLRKMERTYCRSKMDAAWQNLKTQKQICRDMLIKAKKQMHYQLLKKYVKN